MSETLVVSKTRIRRDGSVETVNYACGPQRETVEQAKIDAAIWEGLLKGPSEAWQAARAKLAVAGFTPDVAGLEALLAEWRKLYAATLALFTASSRESLCVDDIHGLLLGSPLNDGQPAPADCGEPRKVTEIEVTGEINGRPASLRIGPWADLAGWIFLRFRIGSRTYSAHFPGDEWGAACYTAERMESWVAEELADRKRPDPGRDPGGETVSRIEST